MSSRARLSLKMPQHFLLNFLSGCQSGRSPFIAIKIWHRKSRWNQCALAQHWARRIATLFRQHGPGNPRQLVRHCAGNDIGVPPLQQLSYPNARHRCAARRAASPRVRLAPVTPHVFVTRLLMPNKFANPPVEYWRGTKPRDAAKSRPLRNCLASPALAARWP